MADLIGIPIEDLEEAALSNLTDDTKVVVEDSGTPVTRKTKLSLLAEWIRTKLAIGVTSTLTTMKKVITEAINELDAEVGNVEDLTTAEKASLVSAVNELDARVTANNTKIRGGLSDSILVDANSTVELLVQFTGILTVPENIIAPDAKPYTVIATAYTSSGVPAEVAVSDVLHGAFTAIIKNTETSPYYFRVYWLALWE